MRSQAVVAIWGEDGMVIPDLAKDEVDLLSSSSLAVRGEAQKRMARILMSWPGGSTLETVLGGWKDGQSAIQVYAFYLRAGHKVFSRVPLAPRARVLS